jgi:hypothetical protein
MSHEKKKKAPNLPDFKEFFFQIVRVYDKVQYVSQKYRKILFVFLLSYLVCSQIWLNHLMDYCHFSYMTKLKKKITVQGHSEISLGQRMPGPRGKFLLNHIQTQRKKMSTHGLLSLFKKTSRASHML